MMMILSNNKVNTAFMNEKKMSLLINESQMKKKQSYLLPKHGKNDQK